MVSLCTYAMHVTQCRMKWFIVFIFVIFFLVAVSTMCDLVHNVETIVNDPGLIFQEKKSGADSNS